MESQRELKPFAEDQFHEAAVRIAKARDIPIPEAYAKLVETEEGSRLYGQVCLAELHDSFLRPR